MFGKTPVATAGILFCFHHGGSFPQSKGQQIRLRGKATGRAGFCIAPLRLARCPQQMQPGLDLRLLHAIVDEWKIQLIIMYGLAQSNSGAQEFNDALLATATQRVQQVNLPAIILGDFNADVYKLPSAHRLATLGYLHLQQLHSSMYGGNMPPTCKEATNPDTALFRQSSCRDLKPLVCCRNTF